MRDFIDGVFFLILRYHFGSTCLLEGELDSVLHSLSCIAANRRATKKSKTGDGEMRTHSRCLHTLHTLHTLDFVYVLLVLRQKCGVLNDSQSQVSVSVLHSRSRG
jgi:hypothetical protein